MGLQLGKLAYGFEDMQSTAYLRRHAEFRIMPSFDLSSLCGSIRLVGSHSLYSGNDIYLPESGPFAGRARVEGGRPDVWESRARLDYPPKPYGRIIKWDIPVAFAEGVPLGESDPIYLQRPLQEFSQGYQEAGRQAPPQGRMRSKRAGVSCNDL